MNVLSMQKTSHVIAGIFLFIIFGLANGSRADVKVPNIFSDNMVLQRDMPLPVWGWADAGENVTVTFNGQKKNVTANKLGEWRLQLDSLKADNTPKQMTIAGKNTLTIKNILVGDVWVCSGQSNMQMNVKSVLQAKKEIAEADYPKIRLMTVPRVANDFLVPDIPVKWQECSPKTIVNFSAPAYFFARELFKELNVPIGLINTNWGGTRIEPWISPEGFRLIPDFKNLSKAIDSWSPTTEAGNIKFQKFIKEMEVWQKKAADAVAAKKPLPPMPDYPGKMNSHQNPTKLYNSMIFPLIPFGIRGALWYQGESNGGEGLSYFKKMKALIGGWRQLWQQGDFPFYYVQLAGWKQSPTNNPGGGDGWARCREAQRKSLSIPNTGMAVTIDIGDAKDIHPKNKQDVGKRLALWALAKDYKKDVVYSGPLYKNMNIEGDKIRISFDNTGSGLMIAEKTALEPPKELKDGKIKWISIQGKDKKWHWADLVIEGNDIIVSNENVKEPVAVRYCFTMNPTGPLLYNKEGLPASPFMTGKLR